MDLTLADDAGPGGLVHNLPVLIALFAAGHDAAS
jgi:hypothetical protein